MLPETEIDNKTDEELAELVLRDQEAYRFLMRRYEPKMLGYVRRLANLPKDDAEDVLQEVFLKVYLNLNAFDRSLKFSSWIYRIAHNEAITHVRRLKTKPQPLPDNDDDGSATTLADRIAVDPDLAGALDRAAAAAQLRSALDSLDAKYREVLILRYLEEKDYREISDILRKPMGTIATLINRAKSALRREVERRGTLKRTEHRL